MPSLNFQAACNGNGATCHVKKTDSLLNHGESLRSQVRNFSFCWRKPHPLPSDQFSTPAAKMVLQPASEKMLWIMPKGQRCS